jgi:hypothetical protein
MLALALLALALQQTEAPPPVPPPPAPPAAPAPRPPRAPAAQKAPAQRPVPAEEREQPVLTGFDKKSGKRFTGDFDETEVGDALRKIAEAADWSIILPRGEHGEVSAHFKNVPAEDALRAVLVQSGLTASLEGGVITVRERSALPSLEGLPRDLERKVRRATEEAMRHAERATREVEREMRRAERKLSRSPDRGDKVVHGDVVVRADQPARDVVAIRGKIKLEPGAHVHDVVAVLGSVELGAGAGAHQVVAVGGDVKLGSGSVVENDVVAVGGNITREEGAEIGGEEVAVSVPGLSGIAGLIGSQLGPRESPVFSVGRILAEFVVYFALGLLILALFPRRMEVVASSFTAHPWKAVFTGLLGLVLLPILMVLLVATIIGIPLVPVAAILAVAAGVLGFAALAFFVGRALPLKLADRGSQVLQLAIGTAVVVLATSIPLLGWMAWVAALLLGFGAVLRTRFGSQTPVLPTTLPPAAPPPVAPPPAAA